MTQVINTLMDDNRDDIASLRQHVQDLNAQVQALQEQLAAEKHKSGELERAKNGASAPTEIADVPSAISEFDETLRRLVQRTAMIVQAEKCVIMVRDRETGDLFARSPAWGMTEEDVKAFRISPSTGISGEVFLGGKATMFHDSHQDPRAVVEHLAELRIRNGVTVPLVIEKRDDENRVVDRVIIGVLHCFNKRYGGDFIDEDERLLERLSRNAAAVIANAQMYQEVVEEKQKLVHTLESLTAGLILVNQNGRIGQMNAQARAIFGVGDRDNPLGKFYQDVIQHAECVAIISRQISEITTPRVATEEEPLVENADEISVHDQDNEEYIYQVHAAAVRDSGDNAIGTVFIFNDITDIRSVERMKTEFVSIVSHELRTPLTPMKGFVRTLLDDENEEWYAPHDRREFYGIIEKNVDRLSRLIDDLLNVSRIEKMGVAGIEMNWAMVDIRKAAEEVLDIQKGRTDRHTLVIDFEPEVLIAETDPDKIQNILQNFVSNAIKYSENGEVRIIGRLEGPSEEYPEGSVLLGVKDHGMGMSERDVKRIGEKFFRAANAKSVGGTGIGLFLVANLIKAHHGTMTVESQLGKGSTFWFRFPITQPKSDV